MLHHLKIPNFKTESGVRQDIALSYQVFGQPLFSAPVVLVNHALTGNSQVAGEDGWWSDLIHYGGGIDLAHYTVLAFNIPGNGMDGEEILNYRDFIARDIARIFLEGLDKLEIKRLYAVIGGSVGGGIAWEMAAIAPDRIHHLIPIAADWKSTDWLIANCRIQEHILEHSKTPLEDARMHAMLCYRTPESLKARFQRSVHEELKIYNVESWLLHHGKKLRERFTLSAYKLNNQLLKSIDITSGDPRVFERIGASNLQIHMVGVDTDLFFSPEENKESLAHISKFTDRIRYGEIHSIHGHDAFLIEFDQLARIIQPVFKDRNVVERVHNDVLPH